MRRKKRYGPSYTHSPHYPPLPNYVYGDFDGRHHRIVRPTSTIDRFHSPPYGVHPYEDYYYTQHDYNWHPSYRPEYDRYRNLSEPSRFSEYDYRSRYRERNLDHDESKSNDGNYYGRGPKSYQRSDDRIREDICDLLIEDPDIDASNIDVDVDDGQVKFSGDVSKSWIKHECELLAESVRGVKRVENQLSIKQN